MRSIAGVFVLLVLACGGSDDDDSAGATSQTQASVSASAEDGPEPTCEANGGMCVCAGTCGAANDVPAPNLTCAQPPDSSGACSSECCLPANEATTAGSSGSSGSSGSGGAVCDCASLPLCTEPGLNCGEMFPDGCCDEAGVVRHCLCDSMCDPNRVVCCHLLEGCPP